MTIEERENLIKILNIAKQLNRENQQRAMERGDIATDLRIASNEAKMEAVYRKQGLDIPLMGEVEKNAKDDA